MWVRSTSTLPSLVLLKVLTVPTRFPTFATMSKSLRTTLPSRTTSKTRWPLEAVQSHWFAKYSRTWIGVPLATGKFQFISLPPEDTQRSVGEDPEGVDCGTGPFGAYCTLKAWL